MKGPGNTALGLRQHPSPGGVYPPEHKEYSRQRPLDAAGLPERLVLPLSQHMGEPASPVVKPGDNVLRGQVLAEARSFISAPVHAPTSGTIEDISMRQVPHPSGLTALCVIIAPDGEHKEVPGKASRTTERQHLPHCASTSAGPASPDSAVPASPPA